MTNKPFPIWSRIICIAIALVPWVVLSSEWPLTVVDRLGHCKEVYCDFARHYYPQASLIAEGQSGIVNGWFYPPTLAILISGLGHLPLSDAIDMWTAFSLLIALGYVLTCSQCLKGCGLSQLNRFLLSTAIVSTSFPVLSSLKWGQVSLLIVLLIILALRRDSRLSGWLLGLAGAMKIYPLLLSFVPLLRKRFFTLGVVVFSTALFAVAIPLTFLGTEDVSLYYDAMFQNNQTLQMRGPLWGGQAWGPSAYRWFIDGDCMINKSDGPLLMGVPSNLLTIGNLILMAVTGFGALTVYKRTDEEMGLAVILCWFGLFSPPGWHHYFCFLPFAQIILWKNATHWPQRVLVGGAFLIERSAVLGLLVSEDYYYTFSQYGGTTLVVALALMAGLYKTTLNDVTSSVGGKREKQDR